MVTLHLLIHQSLESNLKSNAFVAGIVRWLSGICIEAEVVCSCFLHVLREGLITTLEHGHKAG